MSPQASFVIPASPQVSTTCRYAWRGNNGVHEIENLAKPGGPYLPLGEIVDMDATIHTFVDKNHQFCTRLRIVRRMGEF
jgi:hypothetical protein